MAEQIEGIVPPLSVETAAARLGLSRWWVYRLIERGELRPVTRTPVQLNADDVEALRVRRRDEAIAAFGGNLERLAADVRLMLHPPADSPGRRGHEALPKISEKVKAIFGMPMLHAAALPDDGPCRWCGAVVAARMLRIPFDQAQLCSGVGLALLGGPRCEEHRRLIRGLMDGLRAHVHPGKHPRASETPVTVPMAPTPTTPPAGPQKPRPSASRASGGWQPRRKTAAAAARPGVLRCGHALAAGCTCPRRASRQASR